MRSRVPVVGPDVLAGLVHVRASVEPVSPYRLPGAPPDGVTRRRDGLLERVASEHGELVLLRAAQPSRSGPVLLGAWGDSSEATERALARWRWTLGVDIDHRPFLDLAWNDPILGPLVRARPWVRPSMAYRPHEVLLAAITEQLIEYEEALRIQRGLVRLAGVRCERTGLRDWPTPQNVLDLATAQIESTGLSARRTLLMRQVCRLLVRGLDLDAEGEERELVLRRLRAVGGIGPWTMALVGLRGLGDTDASPSGDLGLLNAVGRLMYEGAAELSPAAAVAYDHGRETLTVAPGNPRRDRRGRLPLATELQVHELVSRYSPWSGYAAWHLLMS